MIVGGADAKTADICGRVPVERDDAIALRVLRHLALKAAAQQAYHDVRLTELSISAGNYRVALEQLIAEVRGSASSMVRASR